MTPERQINSKVHENRPSFLTGVGHLMRRINAVFQASTNKLVDPRSSWKTTYDAEAKMNSDMDYLWGSAMVLTLGLLGLTVAAATLK